MRIKTAVVPVAGWGTRLLPVSMMVAKECLPLGRKPAIQHICEQLAEAGIEKIVFVTSARKENVTQLFAENESMLEKLTGGKASIREHFWSTGPFSNVTFETVIQQQQLGLGHAVFCAREYVGDEPFAVALGDCPVGLPGQSKIIHRMINHFEKQNAEIAISFEQVPTEKVHKYGIAEGGELLSDDAFEIEDLVEKPEASAAPSNFAICGRYLFSPEIFEALENQETGAGGEIQLTDAVRRMIHNGATAVGVPLANGVDRFDVGGMDSYVQSFVEFALADPELRSAVETALQQQSRESP